MKVKAVRKQRRLAPLQKILRLWSPIIALGILFTGCTSKRLKGTQPEYWIDENLPEEDEPFLKGIIAPPEPMENENPAGESSPENNDLEGI